MTALNLDAGVLDVTVRHGDAWTVKAELFDAAGGPVTDLSSEGWLSQVRVSKTSDVVDEITVDASNIGDGYVLLTLPQLDVGTYVYDVQTPTPQTPFGGRITVVRDVTRDDD